ncbi:MAG: hypothetical protein Q7S34_01415 [bacterium]|nr:hypothetical protein [bacterium]
MISDFFKKYIAIFICLALSIFLLSKMLLPGYILTLDMVWTPEVPLKWSADTPNNTFLVRGVLHALSLAIPSWAVQKILLVTLFFLLFYMPWRFLPFVEGAYARMFATGIFALNPFVYTRVLAGQWFHLLGYALFPLLLFALVRLSQNPNRRSATIFFLALSSIGFLSVHFLYLACVVSFLWLFVHIVRDGLKGDLGRAKNIALFAMIAGFCFLIVNLFWIVPAMTRGAPLEARFDKTYFSAFGAVENGEVSVMANVAALGGFWGEKLAWRFYFMWPQDSIIFWIAALAILVLVFYGALHLFKNPKSRFHAGVLLGIGIVAYITALGMADTPFKSFNLFLYKHVPLWGGLRDSHKIAGVLALVYAVFSGVGAGALFAKIKKWNVHVESFVSVAIFALPIIFGMYLWGGFHGQLKPAWYPEAWYEARVLIDTMPLGEKVLVLPWHGYLSLDFAENRVVANPAGAFFGYERVVMGRGVEFGNIRDQEVDQAYRDTDAFLLNAENLSPKQVLAGLQERNISSILMIVNPLIPHSEDGLTRWTHFSAENLSADPAESAETRSVFKEDDDENDDGAKTWAEMLPQTTTILEDPSLLLKKL